MQDEAEDLRAGGTHRGAGPDLVGALRDGVGGALVVSRVSPTGRQYLCGHSMGGYGAWHTYLLLRRFESGSDSR